MARIAGTWQKTIKKERERQDFVWMTVKNCPPTPRGEYWEAKT